MTTPENICLPQNGNLSFSDALSLFSSDADDELQMCVPREQMDAYDLHKLGRSLVPALYVVAMPVGALGQFRINYAVANDPAQPQILQGPATALYDPKNPLGKGVQNPLLPAGTHNRTLTAEELSMLKANGARLQTVAGMGMLSTQAIRFGIDLYALSQQSSDPPTSLLTIQGTAVILDAATTATKFADGMAYYVGSGIVGWSRGSAGSYNSLFGSSHRIGIAGSVLQIGAGSTRMICEAIHFAESGEVNGAIVLYSALDMAHGAAGSLYSLHVLAEAQRAAHPAGQTAALMNIVKLGPRMQMGLRFAGGAGAFVGLVANIHAYADADGNPYLTEEEQAEQKMISALGIAGAGLMFVSSFMVTAASAPIAGILVAIAIALLVAQTLYQHRRQISHALLDERPPLLGTID